MAGRTKPCTKADRDGRLRKARQFLDGAELILEFADGAADVADAYVTLCVHAGVAAADVICCARLGRHAQGDSHQEATKLLGQVDASLGNALGTLLGLKTPAGYGAKTTSEQDVKRAGRKARELVDAATSIL